MISKIKDKKKLQFLTKFEETGNISASCDCIGIARNTYYCWYKEDPSFAENVDEIRESIIDHVEGKLMTLIEAGETAATLFFLKTIGKKRGYNEREAPQQDDQETIQPPNVTFIMKDMSGTKSETI